MQMYLYHTGTDYESIKKCTIYISSIYHHHCQYHLVFSRYLCLLRYCVVCNHYRF